MARVTHDLIRFGPVLAGLLALLALCQPARADLQLCNRMSYVIEAAVGLESKGTTETRGWFRIDPGQCRNVLAGEIKIDGLFLHARALAVYGASPLPQTGHADLCVPQESKDIFVIASARICTRTGQRLVRFTAVNPNVTDQTLTANFAEEAEYTAEQARDAAIQRLLVIAGYDATPIDGIRGAKTDAALIQFLQDNKLPVTSAGKSDFFDVPFGQPSRAVASSFQLSERKLLRMKLDFLQAHDVGARLGEPREKIVEAVSQPVDVEGCQLHAAQPTRLSFP